MIVDIFASKNQNNTSLQCHSLYAQLKTAETITNKTVEIFVKKVLFDTLWEEIYKKHLVS